MAIFSVCLALVGAVSARGADTLLTFDELDPRTGFFRGPFYDPIPNGYGGLSWGNFGVIHPVGLQSILGYNTGTVSQSNVAFNLNGQPASIYLPRGSFDLRSAYLTAATTVQLNIRVQGYAGAELLYDTNYTVTSAGPTLAHFNYTGVDRVLFTTTPRNPLAMDNLVVANVDSDGDGVPDAEDQCANTPEGVVVNEHGCSIEQLAPCAGPATGGAWRSHGEYVSAVISAADAFLTAGLIAAEERDTIVREAARSDCGKK
jgi:hypothetical protein